MLLPFSRKHESEADLIGLLYTARACFDPREAPRLWERMGQAGMALVARGRGALDKTVTRIETLVRP